MRIDIKNDYIKLDSLLKFTGLVSSGAEAKLFILDGHATVNGELELRRGRKVRRGDTVIFKGEKIYVC